ncbi:MAG: MTAP family purine nucleoside phosphorylase [archaeon]
MLGIIAGSAFLNAGRGKRVATRYGAAHAWISGEACILFRHGTGVPPHMVSHRANIAALKKLGAARAIGLFSVGSLRKKIRPGSVVVPSDYISLWDSATFFDRAARHVVPGLDKDLRKRLRAAAQQCGIGSLEGVYVQTRGPRLETPAEAKMLSRFGDVVGMTMGTEATLAAEMGIAYAGICSVDNYANGIGAIHPDEIIKRQRVNSGRLMQIARRLVT